MTERESFVERIISLALEEDLGSGDVTTRAVVDPEERGRAVLLANQEVVLAGLPIFERVFHRLSTEITLEAYYAEGDQVSAGSRVCKLEGPLAPILSGERTALNFLQRMSGVATLTRQYVSRVSPWKVKILDTRKTAPGLRWLDKYAVRVGGGDK